jgi:hypothetical protein
MFLDPTGKVIGRHGGEFPVDVLDSVIAVMIEEHESSGLLKRGLFSVKPEKQAESSCPFRGKLQPMQRESGW